MVSVREALKHAQFRVVQVEGKVQQLLNSLSDHSEDPFDFQDAGRRHAAEIEDIGCSLLTREFADLVSQEPLFEPTPEGMAYEELHNRLHNALVDLFRAREIIKGLFCRTNTAEL